MLRPSTRKKTPSSSATPDSVTAPRERALEAEIGQEVRQLRRGLDLTVAQLSAAAGLSTGMLSKIENGAISPSLATLNALASALNVSVRQLFRDSGSEPPCSYVKGGQGTRMNRRGTKAGYLYDLLVGRSFDGDITIEPYLITLGPDAVPHTTFRHAGNEFLYMLSGTMVYRHGQRGYPLRAGDALYFDASARHGPEEFTQMPVSYLSIVTYPRR